MKPYSPQKILKDATARKKRMRWLNSWSLKSLYRNAPIRSLALSKQNICEISHKKLCDSSIMIEKASYYTMNALNKSSELWHNSSSGRKARPHIGAFLYKNFTNHGCIILEFEISTPSYIGFGELEICVHKHEQHWQVWIWWDANNQSDRDG